MSAFRRVEFLVSIFLPSTADWRTVLTIAKFLKISRFRCRVIWCRAARVYRRSVCTLCSPVILYCHVFSAELFGVEVPAGTVVRYRVFV